ncbi:14514_t:CDS:2 [Cetraspora pellucida]|uniref:14514_t:CDS:1 n=1 Tax=Cetraspora pellucida TaxID=1433469 RepID=A0A9N9HSG6_9GLOM|nr:14514_t:CDS:2 [Cetraspora pellucida]
MKSIILIAFSLFFAVSMTFASVPYVTMPNSETIAQCGKPLEVKWTIESQEGPEKQPMYLYQGDNEKNLKKLLTITEACNLKDQKLQYTLPTNLATDDNYAVCRNLAINLR